MEAYPSERFFSTEGAAAKAPRNARGIAVSPRAPTVRPHPSPAQRAGNRGYGGRGLWDRCNARRTSALLQAPHCGGPTDRIMLCSHRTQRGALGWDAAAPLVLNSAFLPAEPRATRGVRAPYSRCGLKDRHMSSKAFSGFQIMGRLWRVKAVRLPAGGVYQPGRFQNIVPIYCSCSVAISKILFLLQ